MGGLLSRLNAEWEGLKLLPEIARMYPVVEADFLVRYPRRSPQDHHRSARAPPPRDQR